MSYLLSGTGTLPHVLQRPVTILRVDPAGVIDDYGNERPAVAERIECWAYLEQTAATEVTVAEQTYEADWMLVLPAGMPLDPWDRVEVADLGRPDGREADPERGETAAAVTTFEVIGTPDRPRRPWANGETQVVATMRRVTA